MRKTIISLVVALASLVPGVGTADGMPSTAPKSGEKQPSAAGEKVTQADLQPNAPDQYTVVKGDTLWGISGKFLKDPWKWPQIWQMNRDQIKDPHWIYPGDVIRLDRSGDNPSLSLASGGAGGAGAGANTGPSGGTAEQAAGNVVKYDPRVRTEALAEAIPTIPGSAIGPFLTRPLVVEVGALETAPQIVAVEENRVLVGAGDGAYADRIGTDDGVNWQIYRPGSAIKDPESGETLGFEAKYVGDARVKRYGNPTTIEVTKAREEIHSGDRLMPAREGGYPNYMPHAPGKPIRARIMAVEGGVAELGRYDVVLINRGTRDGVEIGQVLATLRRGPTVVNGRVVEAQEGGKAWGWLGGLNLLPNPVVPDAAARNQSQAAVPSKTGVASGRGAVKLPDERNGLLFIFRTFDKVSYGIIMSATRPLYVGDVVQTP